MSGPAVTGPLLLGALFGAGLAAATAWAVPARPRLADVFAALHPPPAAPVLPPLLASRPDHGWVAVLGRPIAPMLARTGLPRTALAADLAICGRDTSRHLGEQAATGLLAFLLAPALAAALTLAGIDVSWQLPVWAGLLAAAAGVFVPDLALASEARKRRTELRAAVAGMLDLVAIALAGGAGVEQALRDATDHPAGTTSTAGTGANDAWAADAWATQALRQAIDAAHLTRRPPWATLGELGELTGVTALAELSAVLSLAGSEGARIKATLTARSAALSAHQLAEAEATAVSATEAMVLPVVVLLAGFLVFIGYPAFAAVMTALS